MRFIKIIFFSYVFLFSQFSFALDSLRLLRTLPLEINGDFTVDHFGNIYLYTKNEIQKIDSLGVLKNKYSNNALGKIHSMDVSNPLKILVFYQENSSIVFLDNTLSEQGKSVSLQNTSVEFITHACVSQNNGFWVYDPQMFELKRFDEQLNQLSNSGNLYQITKEVLKPTQIIERDNQIILSDEKNGVYFFDLNGNFIKKFPCEECHLLEYYNSIITYEQDATLMQYHMQYLEKKSIPNQHPKNMVIDHTLYQYDETKKVIHTYRLVF